MAIETVCTSCETRYTVQDDLLGRPMRCPECREVFIVRVATPNRTPLQTEAEKAPAAAKTGETRSDAPSPRYQSGSVADFLQVLSTEAEAAPSTRAKSVPVLPPPVEDPFADSQPYAPPRAEQQPYSEAIPADIPAVEEESFRDFEVIDEPPATKSIPKEPITKAAPQPDVIEADERPPAKAKPKADQKTADEPVVLEVDGTEPTAVKWTPDLAPPPARRVPPGADGETEPQVEVAEEEEADEEEDKGEEDHDQEPPRRAMSDREPRRPDRRRRKKKSRFVLMIFLLGIIIGGLGIGGYWLRSHLANEPERLYTKAKKEYDQKNYEPARKLFEELAKEYPKHQRAREARFFIELCSLRVAVGSVTVRADPAPAEAQLEKFLKATESPEMQPFLEQGKYNIDVWQTTLKLSEDLVGKGTDVFNQESPDESETWLRHAEAVGVIVDRFRPKETDRENVYQQMETLRKQIAGARTRTRLLAAAKERLFDADDKRIDEVRADAQTQTFYAAREAKDIALVDDPAFKQLLADAEKKIQDRVVYKRLEKPIAPHAARGKGGTGLLFAPRVDVPDPNRAPQPPQANSSVFFALSRGVLYALDDGDNGRVLWATRVGIDGDTLPLHLPGNDLHPELVLVVSNDGSQAALTARLARTGEAYWHQTLPSPVIGRLLLVGQRVFVPLSENLKPDAENGNRVELGVVWEIEIANGNALGRIVLGRPLGAGGARRPGTGQLFFPADAKGVYVFDVEKIGPDGGRLDPAFLGILQTGHASGTLRGEPVITAGEGDTPSYLILSFTDGLESMKLRAFPLSAADQPPAIQGAIPPPIALSGWTWFPPYCDTEKLAVVTDRGEFGLFGIKQAGNLDVPLFVLPPTPYLVPDIRIPARGQIVYADEYDFWFLARGQLYHLKIGFDAERGLRLVQRGNPIPFGEPLQPAQVNARGDVALVVTQASASASCRATAIDLRTGKVRWQRQLGLVAQGDPIRIGNSMVLMDHDGGLYKIDTEPLARLADASWLIEEGWLVARPVNDATEAAQFIPGPKGDSACAVLATRTPQGLRIVVRRYVPGQPLEERSAALPAPFAGNAIVLGKQVVVPLANGMLYRMNLEVDRPLEAGPTWRGERVPMHYPCHMAAINDDEFLATDGSRSLNCWRWIGGQDDFSKRGTLTLSERIAAPPAVFRDGDLPRVFVVDIRNNATLWDADRLATNPMPLRAWRGGEKGVVPSGPITNGPFVESGPAGKPRIAFVLDKLTVVWLSPDAAAPLWTSKPKEAVAGDGVVGRPMVLGERMYLTHRAGKCISLDLANGEMRDELVNLKGSAVPGGAAIVINDLLLAPLSDGTVVLQTTGPKRPAAKIPVLLLPLPPLGAVVPLPLEP